MLCALPAICWKTVRQNSKLRKRAEKREPSIPADDPIPYQGQRSVTGLGIIRIMASRTPGGKAQHTKELVLLRVPNVDVDTRPMTPCNSSTAEPMSGKTVCLLDRAHFL